ncbi:GvpL/GvpF family gas vesicle protein [Streptomyces sp. NPDC005438]|uniref:GvpL/GvpF family gas vesicle protein n=1 Tax=Streptomyces sp. NPDC005438 TaxID=3156880 RepID=UPI0033A8EB63
MSSYIYAITRTDHPTRLDGLAPVGEAEAPLRAVRTDTLSAVVSDAPDNLRAKRRDLAAHQAVLERLMEDGAVLPMRFGLVGPSDEDVVAALRQHEETYDRRLTEVDGCVEYNVKATRDEEDLLREILGDTDEIRQLRERARDERASHGDKVRLGELVAAEVRVRQDREGAELAELLAGNTVGHTVLDTPKDHFLNASFLVRRQDAAAFARRALDESERRGEAYSLSVNGPLPPYSFV